MRRPLPSLRIRRPDGRRPRFMLVRILAINRPLNLRHRFALVIHSHRVTRDVEADVSGESHPVPLRQPGGVAASDETVTDVLVPEDFTTAIAGRVLQHFRMPR